MNNLQLYKLGRYDKKIQKKEILVDVYQKNLKALEKNRPNLYKKLKAIEGNERFEVFLQENEENANILDKSRDFLFYKNAKKSNEKDIEEYKKYREYPFLYMFGIGNGKVIEELLKNEKLTQLVVFEPNLELLYIVLNLIDFSQYLAVNKLLLLDYDEVDYNFLINLLHVSNAKFYIRVFDLLLNGEYYEENYATEYKELFQLWIKVLNYVARASGNDITDTFTGLKQHLENIYLMVEKPAYQELLKKESVDTAVIVSTGPSLNKQIVLLKEYQERVCILSLDASLPILIENGIKPDFVFSLERDTPTAEFFKQVKEEEQKEIIYVCASLQHKEVFNAIKNGTMLLVMRPFLYNHYFELHEYGYLAKGMSSANMAHEFASAFGFKQAIIIGQDLAFSKDLKTHAKGHKVANNPLLDKMVEERDFIELEAYGGVGIVYSNIYWEMFKNFIEHHIQESKDIMTTYNSTEGGARIYGAVEIPFQEALEKFALETKKKIDIDTPLEMEIEEKKLQITLKLDQISVNLKDLQSDINETFLFIADSCKVLENKKIDEAIGTLSIGKIVELLSSISKVRNTIENSEFYNGFLGSIAQPLMFNVELEIAEIKVRYVDNPKDNDLKALQWILAHRYWLFSLSSIIENTLHIVEKAKINS